MNKQPTRSKVTGFSTKMVRVVISGTQKKKGPLERFFSFFAIWGAAGMIMLYLGIPVVLLLNFLHDWILQFLGAALILTISEFIVCSILLRIGKAGKTSAKPVRAAASNHAATSGQDLEKAALRAGKNHHVSHMDAAARTAQRDNSFIPLPEMQGASNKAQHALQAQLQRYPQPGGLPTPYSNAIPSSFAPGNTDSPVPVNARSQSATFSHWPSDAMR